MTIGFSRTLLHGLSKLRANISLEVYSYVITTDNWGHFAPFPFYPYHPSIK